MTRISLETQERLHSLDAVRALALLLGIVLHAAASFMPSGFNLPWLIADNSPSVVLAGLTGMIHLFRMSLFFFVAGFFAHLVYHRKDAHAFTRDRLERIALPFVVGWCVMAPLLRFIWWRGSRKAGVFHTLELWPAGAEWSSGQVRLTHLWFLYYLILIYAAIVGVRHLLADRLVCVLQVWVADWNLHWSVKFPHILSIAFAALLASYHYLVRYTFIGAVLNGRRYSRPSPLGASAVVTQAAD
jgi:fucose 4-O-acetylase-like acetyltransferase